MTFAEAAFIRLTIGMFRLYRFIALCALSSLGCTEFAYAQSAIDARWGILAVMAERDFATTDGVLTVRWERFNETLDFIEWVKGKSLDVRFALDPVNGELTKWENRVSSSRVTVALDPSGNLLEVGTASPKRLLWKAAPEKYIFAKQGDFTDILPLALFVPKVQRVAGLISSGRVRPVVPDFRKSSSAATLAVPGSSIGGTTFSASASSLPTKNKDYKVPNLPRPAPVAVQILSKPIQKKPRLALIVGNARYAVSLGPLSNPVNDAMLIAKVLRSLGFDVELLIDGDQQQMKRAISRLGQHLAKAGPGATGLFYFAGHGMQSRGINYLIPVGARIEREADLDLEAVAADTVLSQMEEAGTGTNIVVLDACRNTPILRSFRSGARGLARMEAPNGSFISYSTAPGSTAFDGQGRNSPFAEALGNELGMQAQPIEATFRNVRRAVINATEGAQTPWDASSLTDTFSFNP